MCVPRRLNTLFRVSMLYFFFVLCACVCTCVCVGGGGSSLCRWFTTTSVLYVSRIPELIFEGPELWNKMATDELVLAKDTLLLFVYSTLLQRGAHVILEVCTLVVQRSLLVQELFTFLV